MFLPARRKLVDPYPPSIASHSLQRRICTRNRPTMYRCAKPQEEWALRGSARASTIKVFSISPRSRAGLPRQPIRGGAYGSEKRKPDIKLEILIGESLKLQKSEFVPSCA